MIHTFTANEAQKRTAVAALVSKLSAHDPFDRAMSDLLRAWSEGARLQCSPHSDPDDLRERADTIAGEAARLSQELHNAADYLASR